MDKMRKDTNCSRGLESGGYLPSVVLGSWEVPQKRSDCCSGLVEMFGFSGAHEVFAVYREHMDRMRREDE